MGIVVGHITSQPTTNIRDYGEANLKFVQFRLVAWYFGGQVFQQPFLLSTITSGSGQAQMDCRPRRSLRFHQRRCPWRSEQAVGSHLQVLRRRDFKNSGGCLAAVYVTIRKLTCLKATCFYLLLVKTSFGLCFWSEPRTQASRLRYRSAVAGDSGHRQEAVNLQWLAAGREWAWIDDSDLW